MIDISTVVSAYLGTFLALLTVLVPVGYVVRKKLRKFNPLAL